MGHFARDTIISPNGSISNSLGGGVTFGTLASFNYNVNQKIGVFSEKGKDFNIEWLEIFDSKIDTTGICTNSEYSTNFEIEYFPVGGRILTLKAKANPLMFKNLPSSYLDSKSFMISSIANEISFDFIKQLVNNTKGWIGIDIQGFIRDFQKDGSINPNPLQELVENMHKIMSYCGNRLILKASGDEINYIANCTDVIKSTQQIACKNNFILCTTLGPDGSLIKYGEEKMIHIPAFKPNLDVVDETGAGDCYLSVFLSEFIRSDRTWEDIKRCGYLASSAASFLIEKQGPKGYGTRFQIQERLRQKNTIPSPFHENIKYNNF